MYQKILALLSIAIMSFALQTAHAAEAEIYTGFLNSNAVSGYDTVAYFTQAKAVKGDAKLSTKWKDATWLFSSQENLDKFIKTPEKYTPQYGGYCAYAVALNKTASADPTAWKIIDQKLYLNYDADIKKTWEEKSADYIKDADKNWPHIIK